ncbi:transcriptional regulator [Frondihabitans sucicola]|uniref:Transcriptional regulator n=1 Tax=Frondihabitans sucicola TaxID=1268041 RepID=A0ABM8GUA9_9MICO|nr:GAF and ANTAR domain-containing protein [Frondihabitans sucicola]BDZ52053.1 transcriptional regulator [Frondihabitans sucicola]
MTGSTREAQLLDTFVTLADTLVVGFDTIDLLQILVERCVVLFDATDAGIMLDNGAGELEVIASTSERSHLIGLLQLGAGEGPCVEAYSTGRAVSVSDVEQIADRWPTFAARSTESGYAAVDAVPLRLRDTALGSLNLFREAPGALNPDDASAVQALADVATISILQERAVRQTDVARDQLQRALDSRVIIEQAKGIVSYTRDVDMDDAFKLIRDYSRSNRRRLSDVAAAVVDRSIRL